MIGRKTFVRAAAVATLTAGAVAGTALGTAPTAQAAWIPGVDLVVTKLAPAELNVFGCGVRVTNAGTTTAHNVRVEGFIVSGPDRQYLGDLAPGQSATFQQIDCAFYMFGAWMIASSDDIDVNPFNNVVRAYP